MTAEVLENLEREGWAWHRASVDSMQLSALREEVERLAAAEPATAHGIRGLLQHSPTIARWAKSDVVRRLLPAGLEPVRGILFDKIPGANWVVAWHQDLTLAVVERRETPGYGPWSSKDGAWHVQPPVALLDRMVTLRLHLDDTPATNGALRVLPRSHACGKLSAEDIQQWRADVPERVCEALAGDILLMKPLILHASSPATQAEHRRVIHVEFAPPESLHEALQWRNW
ncbi:MAG: phytanoyl-CoA dioxygenase family protein [Roseimicrobium sp.]